MDFKKLISQLDQLHEADVKHKGTYGTSYQGDDDEDDDKKTAPASTEKRGRGRPKKAGGAADTSAKYSGAKDLQSMMVGNIPKDSKELKKLPKIKNTLKDWIESIDEQMMLAEADQVTMEPAKQNTQVIKQGNKTLGTVSNPQLAAQIKQSIGKGEMSLAGSQLGEEDEGKPGKNFAKIAKSAGKHYGSKEAGERVAGAVRAKLMKQGKIKEAAPPTHDGDAGAGLGAGRSNYALEGSLNELSKNTLASYAKKASLDSVMRMGKAVDDGDGVGAKKAGSRYAGVTKAIDRLAKEKDKQGMAEAKNHMGETEYNTYAGWKSACRKAGADKFEGDSDICQAMKNGKGIGEWDGATGSVYDDSHKKKKMAEGKKPDFVDLDKDGDKKESMKKAASDAKKGKKKVAEGMDQRLEAARAEGRAHGLRGHAHCGNNYDDMEEARCYHDGYKAGLDECYGQMPIQGYVGEMSNEVEDMASYGAHTPELDEMDKTSYMKQQAIKTPGKTFNAFGQTMHDSDVLDEFAFESLDRQLNALLNEDSVSEGMTVSISKGQENSPDSVSINASDAEADSLLAFVKQAGLGIFGGDDHGDMQDAVVTSEPSIASSDAIEVVDDHDGMLSLIRKMAGQGAAQPAHDHSSEDYADEEETCNECGMAYESCGGKHGGEMVDEMESEDQMTYNVAEDNPPDTGAAETEQEVQDVAQANSSAASFDKAQAAPQAAADLATESEEDEEDEEQKDGLDESSFFNLYKKLALLSEESTAEKDAKAEKAGKKVAKDIEYDEGHKGKDDNKAEKAGKKVTKDIEYDDKKDKKLDEWANSPQQSSHDEQFETDIDFMTNIISGGLNKQKIRVGSGGQTTVPVVATVTNESTDLLTQWKKLSGLK
jgi:hypothetical protein